MPGFLDESIPDYNEFMLDACVMHDKDSSDNESECGSFDDTPEAVKPFVGEKDIIAIALEAVGAVVRGFPHRCKQLYQDNPVSGSGALKDHCPVQGRA